MKIWKYDVSPDVGAWAKLAVVVFVLLVSYVTGKIMYGIGAYKDPLFVGFFGKAAIGFTTLVALLIVLSILSAVVDKLFHIEKVRENE